MDKMRWRYADTNPVVAAVEPETVIEVGDLLWQDGDRARPAGNMRKRAGQTSVDRAEAFCEKFLGVAMQRSRAGDHDPIRVAATGVFEFEVRYDRGAFELGDLIGPSVDLTLGLFNQQVQRASCERYAIGRVAKRARHPAASVLVDIRSTVMTGGIMGDARLAELKRLTLDPGDVLVWEINCPLSAEQIEQMLKALVAIAPQNRVAVVPGGRLAVVDAPRLEPHKFNPVVGSGQ